MSEVITAKGSCLCGSVTLVTSSLKNRVGTCHCGMCRKWGGGPLMAVSCGQDTQFAGMEFIKVYDSSDWAERGFCTKCGTHLFYRLKESQEHQIPVGLFGNSISPEFSLQVFVDKKPDFYNFSNKTKELTEAEIIEMFAPQTIS